MEKMFNTCNYGSWGKVAGSKLLSYLWRDLDVYVLKAQRQCLRVGVKQG